MSTEGEQLSFAVVRPPLRLWKNEPLTILGDAKKAALKADVSLRWWDEFRSTADACLRPECAPEEMEKFLDVVRSFFECVEAPSFRSTGRLDSLPS